MFRTAIGGLLITDPFPFPVLDFCFFFASFSNRNAGLFSFFTVRTPVPSLPRAPKPLRCPDPAWPCSTKSRSSQATMITRITKRMSLSVGILVLFQFAV